MVDEGEWPDEDGLKVLLFGQSGTGKTTFWATFPKPIRAFIISGGNKPGELRSISTPEMKEVVFPKRISSTKQLMEEVKKAEGGGYATLVLDHLSGLQDLALSEILGRPVPEQKGWGLASQQQYGQVTGQCKDVLRAMLDFSGNVVVISQEREFKGREDGPIDDAIRPTVGAGVSPSLAGWIHPACDYNLQTFKRPRMVQVTRTVAGKEMVKTERATDRPIEFCARCEPHDTIMTKFRVPRGHKLPDAIVDPTYEKVLAVINGTYEEETQ